MYLEYFIDLILCLSCGLHQIDLVLPFVYKDGLGDSFDDNLTGLIEFLNQQRNLVEEELSTYQKVADTRWVSMES